MDHVRAGCSECFDLVNAEMNTVCQGDVPASQTKAIQISNVAQSAFLLDQLTFSSVLRSMSMDHHAAFACKAGDFLEQFTCATDCKARRKAVSDAAIMLCRATASSSSIDSAIELFSLLLQGKRDFIAFVHHALADGGAKSSFLDNLKDLGGVVHCLHCERTGSAALDELGNTETSRGCNRGSRVRRLHGPDALLQPIDEGEIVSGAAKDCLAEMDVRLYKARDDGAVSGIDRSVGCLSCAANIRDASVSNENVAAHDGVAASIVTSVPFLMRIDDIDNFPQRAQRRDRSFVLAGQLSQK